MTSDETLAPRKARMMTERPNRESHCWKDHRHSRGEAFASSDFRVCSVLALKSLRIWAKLVGPSQPRNSGNFVAAFAKDDRGAVRENRWTGGARSCRTCSVDDPSRSFDRPPWLYFRSRRWWRRRSTRCRANRVFGCKYKRGRLLPIGRSNGIRVLRRLRFCSDSWRRCKTSLRDCCSPRRTWRRGPPRRARPRCIRRLADNEAVPRCRFDPESATWTGWSSRRCRGKRRPNHRIEILQK